MNREAPPDLPGGEGQEETGNKMNEKTNIHHPKVPLRGIQKG